MSTSSSHCSTPGGQVPLTAAPPAVAAAINDSIHFQVVAIMNGTEEMVVILLAKNTYVFKDYINGKYPLLLLASQQIMVSVRHS